VQRLVFVGFGCNNRCVVCAQGELRAVLAARSEADVARDLAAIAVGDVAAFVGGEPTLAGALIEWLKSADERGARRVLLQTNARRLAYPAYAKALRDATPKLALDVSLFGSTAAMHDFHTRAPGSFAETGRGIRNARAAGIPVGVSIVVTRSNYRHLSEIVELARALGADSAHLAPLELLGSAMTLERSVSPSGELTEPHLARAVATAARKRMRIVNGPVSAEDDRFAGTGVTRLQ
jgi:MoaA/NifB/PqqE/SkfB family radical SAM enzyme